MQEESDVKFNKTIKFEERGQVISLTVELINIVPGQYKSTEDFLETMFKEIKKLL